MPRGSKQSRRHGWLGRGRSGPEEPAFIHDDWVSFAEKEQLPIDFNVVGNHPDSFIELLEKATHLVTTSISEGFGLTFLDPAFLNKYKTQAAGQVAAHQTYNKRRFDHGSAPVQLWMGETGGAGGATAGATEVNGHFRDVFWYADKLGIAAQLGHDVVCRQSLADLISTKGAKPTAHFGQQPIVYPAYW